VPDAIFLGRHSLLTEEDVSQLVQEWAPPHSVDPGQQAQAAVLDVIAELANSWLGRTVGVAHCTELEVFQLHTDEKQGCWHYPPKSGAVRATDREDSHQTIERMEYHATFFLLKVLWEQLRPLYVPPQSGNVPKGYQECTYFAKKNVTQLVGYVRGVDFAEHEVVDAVALADSLWKFMTWKDKQAASAKQFLFQWSGFRLCKVDARFVACAAAKIAFETLPYLPFI
jgi:hypothetical protein